MMPTGQPAPEPRPNPPAPPAIRASDQDREAVLQRLQLAFAERRLDDDEFDARMRATLTARTHAELDVLTADLPAAAPGAAMVPATSSGRWAVSYKSSIRRGGRWKVPARFSPVVYKGTGWIDLRAAELSAPVTAVTAVAYKSRIEILVPPGVRIEIGGLGVSKAWSAEEAWQSQLPADAPVVQVKGAAYKGTIEVRTRPSERELPR